MNIEEHFTQIYKNNSWHGIESKSGTGSDLETTKILRPQLVELVDFLNIQTMVDIPCGDFHWMKEIVKDLNIDMYLGIDIVKEMIESNKLKYESLESKPKIWFSKASIIDTVLPQSDLIFSRDCLVHFSYATARKILDNIIKSNSIYLLMTTFTSKTRVYPDILDGQWRAINFEAAPFNLPPPLRIINEGCTEDNNNWTDKSLALWEISSLRG